jgi:hypothetical protein
MEKESFGVIISFKMLDFDLPREDVLNAFHEAGIDEGLAPKERMPRKAFQKALKESIEGEDGFMIRPVVNDGSSISSGLVRESKDGGQKDLKYNVCNVLTLNSDLGVITGKSDFRTEAIVDSYKDYLSQLGTTEILAKIKYIFFVSMGIDILCDKCIFVPNKYKQNIDKVVKLFDILKAKGAGIEVEIMGVDSDTQTRNTIVKQFTIQTLKNLQDEIDFCLDQRQKFQDGTIKYLRPSAFRKQAAKIKTLEDRVKTYMVLLELSQDEEKVITEKLDEVEKEITHNMDLADKSNKKSGQEIVAEMKIV